MPKNTGEGHREGAVDERSQIKNPKTGDFVKRDRDHDIPDEGEFMDVHKDGETIKGVAEEPDRRRKGGS